MDGVCVKCSLTLFDLFKIISDDKKLFEYICNHSLIKNEITCPKCQNKVNLHDSYMFRCQKVVIVRGNKKVKRVRCQFKKSAFSGTFFSNAKITPGQVLELAYWFLLNENTQETIQQQVNIAHTTLVDWFSFFREVCLHYCETNSEILGGDDKVVEIDEAKFGKRKYNKGRVVGFWGF